MDQTPLPDDLRQGIAHNVDHLWNGLLKDAGVAQGAWEDGVHYLESVILHSREEMPEDTVDTTADLIGAFLGQAIVELHGGSWVETPDGPAVALEGGGAAFPFTKVTKLIRNGGADSILSFLQVIPQVQAQSKGAD